MHVYIFSFSGQIAFLRFKKKGFGNNKKQQREPIK